MLTPPWGFSVATIRPGPAKSGNGLSHDVLGRFPPPDIPQWLCLKGRLHHVTLSPSSFLRNDQGKLREGSGVVGLPFCQRPLSRFFGLSGLRMTVLRQSPPKGRRGRSSFTPPGSMRGEAPHVHLGRAVGNESLLIHGPVGKLHGRSQEPIRKTNNSPDMVFICSEVFPRRGSATSGLSPLEPRRRVGVQAPSFLVH